MKTKLVFATASALSLLMAGAAYAGNNNQSTVYQHGGNDNTASVTQNNGNNNSAGTTSFNTSGFLLESDGSYNDINILQLYDGNSIGKENTIYKWNEGDPAGYGYGGIDAARVAPYAVGQHGLDFGLGNGMFGDGSDFLGVHQTGNHNQILINQTGAYGTNDTAGNDIVSIVQNGYAGATDLTNYLKITQSNGGARAFNWIGVIWQKNISGYTGVYANRATIDQEGGGYNAGNRVFGVLQNGYQNNLTITQSGTNNVVTTAQQDVGTSNGANNLLTISQTGTQNWVANAQQLGNNNYSVVTQSGTNNKVDNLTMAGDNNGLGVGYFTGYASTLANATLGAVTQLGDNNYVNEVITGNWNQFGLYQNGSLNSIDGGASGNSNQVAVVQIGTSNSAKFWQDGSFNNAAILQ